MSHTHEVFQVLNEFKNNKEAIIDWSVVVDNDELFEMVLDGLDTLLNNISLLSNLSEAERINLVGKLAIQRATIAFLYGNGERYKDFLESGAEITKLMHAVIGIKDLMGQAEERFGEYEDIEADLETLDEIPLDLLVRLRPVFIAIALMTLITIDQPEYH